MFQHYRTTNEIDQELVKFLHKILHLIQVHFFRLMSKDDLNLQKVSIKIKQYARRLLLSIVIDDYYLTAFSSLNMRYT